MVVPEGFLFRKDLQKTREYLLDRCNLQSVISLPQGVFLPYTGVKTNIIYLTKVKQKQNQDYYWYFDVKNDGFTLDNSRRKLDNENDIEKFLAFRNIEKQEKNEILNIGFKQITIDEIKKNDFVLSGNRYKEFFDYSKTKHELIEIGDIFKTTSGGTPLRSQNIFYKNGTIPWLKSGEVKDYIYSAEEFITEDALKNSSAKIFPENTVLIAMYGATAGQVGLLKFKAATNQAICGIFPNPKVLPEYLYFILKSKTQNFVDISMGGAQPNISQEIIRRIKIPVPSLEEQHKILHELLNYEAIVNNAKLIVERYKPIIPNQPDWNYVELYEVCKYAGGTQPPKSTFIYKPREGYIRLLQIRDYKSDENAVYIPKTDRLKICSEDDIMIWRYGPPVFQILRGKSGAYNVALIKCIPDKKQLTTDWLYYFLSSNPIQEHIIGLSERSRQAGVSPSDLNKLKIPLPPIDIQREVVQKIKEEEMLITANEKLIEIFSSKISEKINTIWGT
jgi:restriction endonuclease S subunit